MFVFLFVKGSVGIDDVWAVVFIYSSIGVLVGWSLFSYLGFWGVILWGSLEYGFCN